jgi:hypothetical protein
LYKEQHPMIIPDAWRPYSTDNFIEVTDSAEATSFVRGGDEGTWRGRGRNGVSLADDDPAPHEFGHLLGLQDRYDDLHGDRLRSNPNEAKRWAGNIMREPAMAGRVEQRNINNAVGDALDRFLDARSELKAQTGIELNSYRTKIDGNSSRDDAEH